MPLLFFFVSLFLLLLEGWLIAGLFTRDRWLRVSLALPLSALSNVLMFFLMTIVHIPLRAPFVIVGHLAVVLMVLWNSFGAAPEYKISSSTLEFILPARPKLASEGGSLSNGRVRPMKMLLVIVSLIIIANTFLYSASHSLILPTFQYDSATNWIMRSKISFLEEHIVFDNDSPHEAIKKPHYPFLLHAWHLMGNLGQPTWSDRAANTLSFLLSWSMLVAVGILITRLRDALAGLVGVALLCTIPLFAVHLGQGYADHLVALFASLALLAFVSFRSECDHRWLLLSGIFAAAAVWTKDEGLFSVFLPWLVLLGASWFFHRIPSWRQAFTAGLLGAILAVPWPLFALLSGFSLTPHGQSDTHVGWHPEGLREAISVFFHSGSFGLFWYLLPATLLLILWRLWQRDERIDRSMMITLLFGMIAFCIVLAIYTLTPNVEYLLNAQSFDRQMLTPSCLLLLSALLILWPRNV